MPEDPSQIKIFVDWSGNGTFLEAGEDVSLRWLSDAGIVWERGRDSLRSFAAPRAGVFEAVLDNRDKVLSLENQDSPLFGNLEPGRKVRLLVVEYLATQPDQLEILTEAGQALIVEENTRVLWTGYLDGLPQLPEWENLSVGLPAIGPLSRLKGLKVSTALFQNIKTGQALNHLLDEAGWPADERVIQTGVCTLQWWHLNGADAFEAARAILATEGPGAIIYEDARGNFVFEDRHARALQARSVESQFTFTDEDYLQRPKYDPLLKDVINVCEMEVTERAVSEMAVIWEAGELLELMPNEARQITAQASGNDPFTNAQVPLTNNGADEVQTIFASGLAGAVGTMRLSFRGVQTRDLGIFTPQAEIQYEFERLSTTGIGNIIVAGGFNAGNLLSFTFTGTLANTDVEPIGISFSLTGGSNPNLALQETIKGGPPDLRVISGSIVSITLDRTSGGYVTLTITAGPNGARVEGLRLRAQAVPVVRTQKIKHSVDASASQLKYGPRPPSLNFLSDIKPNYARSLMNAVVLSNQWPRPQLTFEVEEQDETILTCQFAREMSDRITVVESHTGIDGDYMIERMRQTFNNVGIMSTQFGCEKADPRLNDLFIIGKARIGTSHIGF